MVSDTVEVVSVFEVIEPCVKLGTTGTDIAVWTFARADTTTTIASFIFVVVYFKILLCCQVIKEVIYHCTVSSFTNCPVATVPAPPAVIVITPAVVIVPAKSPAVPAAVETWSEKLLTAPTVGADCDTASP